MDERTNGEGNREENREENEEGKWKGNGREMDEWGLGFFFDI